MICSIAMLFENVNEDGNASEVVQHVQYILGK